MQRIEDNNDFQSSREYENKNLDEIKTEEEIRLLNFKEEKFALDM